MPTFRIGKVIHRYEIGNRRAKVKRRAHHQESLRPGKALERNAKRAPYFTAGAVGAEQPAARARLLWSAAFQNDMHRGGILCHPHHLGIKLDAEIRIAAELLVEDARQLRLLA